ncbi:MAG: hypothetical protein QOI10_1051 [Solirubrobacterales bacterium]|jgi:hypothetical protein|nr:hypothetical protein [Solirubrobacterales bacterium]
MLNGNGSVDTSTHRVIGLGAAEPSRGNFEPQLVAVIVHRSRTWPSISAVRRPGQPRQSR